MTHAQVATGFRAWVKRLLPVPVRKLLRKLLHYAQRNSRWAIILFQMRGASWRDQSWLVISALAAPWLSLRNLAGWQDPVLLNDAKVVVRGIGRFELRRRSDDLWHVLPWRERRIHRELRRHLRNGGVFVDAGANIGIYSVLASQLVGEEGRVIAVEMVPDTAAILRRHLYLNGCGNAVVVDRALAGRCGDTVPASVPRGSYGQASIVARAGRGTSELILVETITLDAICHDLETIDLLKMDLEGAEALALAGATKTMPKLRRVIVESLPGDSSDAREVLRRCGFGFRLLGRKDLLAEPAPQLQVRRT